MCFSTIRTTWLCWLLLLVCGWLPGKALAGSVVATISKGGDDGRSNALEDDGGAAARLVADEQLPAASSQASNYISSNCGAGKSYDSCYAAEPRIDIYLYSVRDWRWRIEIDIISGSPPAPDCSAETGTIPGGDIVNSGTIGGGGVYNVDQCAYTCGVNYSLLDGQTSVYDATQCRGLGTPYTTDSPDDYPDSGAQCKVSDAQGNCLDMDNQEGGGCPAGTTYGKVDGTEVCVKSSDGEQALDEGTAGPSGEGGTSSGSGSDSGSGDGSGTGDGSGSGDGSGDGTDDGSGSASGGGGIGTGEEGEGEGEYSSNDCDAPPTCSGDAIQCGIVREVWEDRCQIVEAGEKADDYFGQKTNGVGKLTDDGLSLVDTFEVDLSEKVDGLGNVSDPNSGSCPQPEQINLSLGSYEIEFTPYCDLAQQLRPLVLFIFSFLGAVAVARTLMRSS